MPATETPNKTTSSSASSAAKFKPFTLSFDNGRNGTMILPVVTLRLRMTWLRQNFYNRTNRFGQPSIKSMGRIEAMPDIPGMELHVRPHKQPNKTGWIEYSISDPLKNMPDKLEQVNKVLRAARIGGRDSDLKAVPSSDWVEMDPDLAKTFLIALRGLVDQEWAHQERDTACPTAEEIAALPGDELYDPGNPQRTRRLYMKDVMAGAGAGRN